MSDGEHTYCSNSWDSDRVLSSHRYLKAVGNRDLGTQLWVMIHTMVEAAHIGVPADDRERIEPFLGSWALVSFEHVLLSGEVSRPFGDSPTGSILYQSDGQMSAQLSVGSPTRLVNDDPDQASAEEATQAWRTYFGYWGSFKIVVEKRVVVHRVEGSSFSNWIGTEQVRHFNFDGAEHRFNPHRRGEARRGRDVRTRRRDRRRVFSQQQRPGGGIQEPDRCP